MAETDDDRVLLVPQKGVLVIHPDVGRPLPAEGARVRLDTYWRRRIADGSVTVGKPPRRKTPPTTEPTEAKKE